MICIDAGGHKFAIKALLCNTQYFYRADSDMSLNNTHRMYSCISSAKWLRERATTLCC